MIVNSFKQISTIMMWNSSTVPVQDERDLDEEWERQPQAHTCGPETASGRTIQAPVSGRPELLCWPFYNQLEHVTQLTSLQRQSSQTTHQNEHTQSWFFISPAHFPRVTSGLVCPQQ